MSPAAWILWVLLGAALLLLLRSNFALHRQVMALRALLNNQRQRIEQQWVVMTHIGKEVKITLESALAENWDEYLETLNTPEIKPQKIGLVYQDVDLESAGSSAKPFTAGADRRT